MSVHARNAHQGAHGFAEILLAVCKVHGAAAHACITHVLSLRSVQISGEVNQENAMLSEEVQEKGYALMCVSTPQSDCVIEEITEEEILDQVMQS